jgi:hypothetical protein
MVKGPHRVEIRDDVVLKTFSARFDTHVERHEALRLHLDGAELPSGWRARVPALIQIDPATSSVTMTRGPGDTVHGAMDRGLDVPWAAIGAALGHLHRQRAGGEGDHYVHGDLHPNNILLCPEAREVWVIDPAPHPTNSRWQDLSCLLWVIFRRSWGLGAAGEVFRGWRHASGLPLTLADVDEGWGEIFRLQMAGQTSHVWARRAIRWVFRHVWIPLALGLSRR